MKLVIIIPALNEDSVIRNVLETLPKKISGVGRITSIVIDDGSTDKTSEIASKYADKTVRHLVNLGVGAATVTGLEAAKKLQADIAITIDADGQHDPADIKKVIKPILEGKADVVIGTRMANPIGMPRYKVFGNWMMNFLTFLIFNKWTSDSQSGMRAFNKKALKKMDFHSMGYEICSETLGEIKRNKLKLAEVPIEVIYSDYSKAKGQNWINGINVLTKMLTIKISGKK